MAHGAPSAQFIKAGRTGAVGRLEPTLAAAGHAGDQAQTAIDLHPVAEQGFKKRRKPSRIHGQDAALFQNLAAGPEQGSAQ